MSLDVGHVLTVVIAGIALHATLTVLGFIAFRAQVQERHLHAEERHAENLKRFEELKVLIEDGYMRRDELTQRFVALGRDADRARATLEAHGDALSRHEVAIVELKRTK